MPVADEVQAAVVMLDEVLITPELAGRPVRDHDVVAEAQALIELAGELAKGPRTALQKLTDTIVALCLADSAGISIAEADGTNRRFRWTAVSGRWADKAGDTMPVDASPSAVVIARDMPLLFDRPERVFPAAAQDPRIHELLLVPFHLDGRPVGTLWAIAHGPDRRFDTGDARLLTGLARFAAMACRLIAALDEAEAGRLERERMIRERAAEERYRAFVMASADMVYRMSPDWSQMWHMHGQGVLADTATVRSNWMDEYILPGDRERIGRQIDHAIRTKTVFELDHAVRRADGTPGWTLSRAVPILGDDGAILEWLGTASDRTDERAAAERLRISEERYRVLVESVDEGFCIIEMLFDADGEPCDYRFIETNPAFERQTGLIDAVGRTMHDIAPGHERSWFDTYGRVATTGQAIRFEREAAKLGRWYDVYACRIGDPAQRRVAILFRDIMPRRRDQAALREREERLRQFGEHSPDTLWVMDAQADRLEYLSPAYERMWGEPRQEAMNDLSHWRGHIHPDDRASAADNVARLVAGERHSVEYRIVRSDGEQRWIFDTGFPIKDETGRVTRLAGVAQDLTARRTAEDRVRESERRFRTLSEGVPQLVWRAVDHGRWTWASPQWTSFTGQAEADSHDWGWIEPVHPDDRDAARDAWKRAQTTGEFQVDYRLRRIADGRYRWFTTRATPVRDDDGALIEWLGTSTDVDDLRRLQVHQQLLLAELQHRVRNSLAVIRSIARRTAATSKDVDEFSMHLEGRLASFARTQAAVTRDPAGGLDLRTIVVDELMAHLAHEGEQAHVTGPAITLQSKAGETLALAFHELATNAVKYGGLSVVQGSVRVSWRIEGAEDDRPQATLIVTWDETSPGATIRPPTRRGFGTELLEDTLAYELEADTVLDFRPDGLLCTITMPFDDTVGRIA